MMIQSNLGIIMWFTKEYNHRDKHSITRRATDKLTLTRLNVVAGDRGKAVDCIYLKGRLEE